METEQSSDQSSPRTVPPGATAPELLEGDGQRRVMIEGVTPEIDRGRHPIKRVPGERVVVEADVFADGHDLLTAILKFRHAGENSWSEIAMEPLGNDRWSAQFEINELGVYYYTVEGWMDPFGTWRHDLRKRIEAEQDVSVDLLIGAKLVEDSAGRANEADAKSLRAWAQEFSAGEKSDLAARTTRALDEDMAKLTMKFPDRAHAAIYAPQLCVAVDPILARTGAWYEMFPRSCPGKAGPHGTFRDVEAHLPRVAQMGFDVLYLPPIHPIGQAFRKGKNNNPACEPGEPGSPWGIGAAEGGHRAIHPELGTLEDFRSLVNKAREMEIEIALDFACQCSPDHPWVREHPSWFRQRPDGTIQYAEICGGN
jgi:starch synthase (maltosyl-transferring)